MRRMRYAFLAAVLSTAPALPAAAYTVTFFGSSLWQASDATLGVADCTIEGFEDVLLATGLTVRIAEDDGSYAEPATDTLATTFNPSTDDPFGAAFVSGPWDGSNVILNTVNNMSGLYTDATVWRDIRFGFPLGVRKVGFSIQQMQISHPLLVNGLQVATLSTMGGFALGSGRQGYVVITADSGDFDIGSVDISMAQHDGYAFDHVAFGPSQQPVEPVTWGAVKALYRR